MPVYREKWKHHRDQILIGVVSIILSEDTHRSQTLSRKMLDICRIGPGLQNLGVEKCQSGYLADIHVCLHKANKPKSLGIMLFSGENLDSRAR